MVRARLVPAVLFLGLLLSGCQQVSDPLAFEQLGRDARNGDGEAVIRLVGMLGEKQDKLNDQVYKTLIEVGQAAVPALIGGLETSDRIRREYILAALGNLKAAEAVESICLVLQQQDLRRRYAAAWALGEIADARALPSLLQALGDDDSEVRKYATRSLIKLNQQAVEPLVQYLNTEIEPVAAGGAIRALGDLGDAVAVPSLLARADSENRGDVLQALGKLKDPQAEAVLIAALKDPQWQHRMKAAVALGGLGSSGAAGALTGSLSDPQVVVRESSARALEALTGQPCLYENENGEKVRPDNIYH